VEDVTVEDVVAGDVTVENVTGEDVTGARTGEGVTGEDRAAGDVTGREVAAEGAEAPAAAAGRGALAIEGVSKIYGTRKGDVHALEDISLTVRPCEFVSLLGTSGCGKSTLLRIIGGLETPTAGRVLVDGREVHGPGADRGMVFQAYTLFPWLTVMQNIGFGLRQKGIPKSRCREVAHEYVDLVGLRGFEHHYPRELSGGMMQRVAIARALANDPAVLLLDEPFGALDVQTRQIMQELLLSVWQKSPKTIIMVTHDIEEAILLADRVALLSARPGRLAHVLDVDTLTRPRDYHVRSERKFIALRDRAAEFIRSEYQRTVAPLPE
jgi:ABC-type nitrate/sulfonate/bicarbonate transport system ATPase subunit